MAVRKETWRFWTPLVAVGVFAIYVGKCLVEAHLDPEVSSNLYTFEDSLTARRGSISCLGQVVAASVRFWRYSLDPPSVTNAPVRAHRRAPARTREEIVRTIAQALKLDYRQVLAMAKSPPRAGWRNQFLAESDDPVAYEILTDRTKVRGVAVADTQVRRFLLGRSLCHVLGSVNAEGVGSSGIEQSFNRGLAGTPGKIVGYRDGRRQELRERRQVSVAPIAGDCVDLTIDLNLQHEAEQQLDWGMREYAADAGWCLILDAKTAAVKAMVSRPDFDPTEYGRTPDNAKVNRTVAYTYEPGSVMKCITAAAALESGRFRPTTQINTDRYDSRYFKLPGDGNHQWPATMSLREAIIHSSNIVMGKISCDLGPAALYRALRDFGFGEKTQLGLPGEEKGILWDWRRWNKASWSRVGIGQAVAVTALQLAGAYQALANDGVRMRPYLVNSVTSAAGVKLIDNEPLAVARPCSATTARAVREMMLGVTETSEGGTARRAKVKGYSVAGKTGTAQKAKHGQYQPGLFCASFCGIIPSGIPQKRPDGETYLTDPELVILVVLDFDHRRSMHQGGNTSAVVFRRLAKAAMRQLNVSPDRPDELVGEVHDEYEQIMDERAAAARLQGGAR